MKIYAVKTSCSPSKPTYVVCDTYAKAEELFQKIYSGVPMNSIELISEDVINMWAQ